MNENTEQNNNQNMENQTISQNNQGVNDSNSPKRTIGLIAGIASLVLFFLAIILNFVAPVLAVVALVLGVIAGIIGIAMAKGGVKALGIVGLILDIIYLLILSFLLFFTNFVWGGVQNNLALTTACATVDANGNYSSYGYYDDEDITCKNFVCSYTQNGKTYNKNCKED